MGNNNSAVFNTALVYGMSGTGKTSQIGPLALYILRKYGKKTRYITADGGGWRPIQPYIDAGIIEPLSLLDVENPLVRLRDLQNGYWPDQQGKYVKDAKAFNDVGMYVVESFSSIADLLKAFLVETGRKITQEVVAKFTEYAPEVEGTGKQRKYDFGNASVSHYGFVQQEIGGMIRNFQGLLGEGLNQIVYGTLCATGEDDRGVKVLGPEVIGKALTAVIPQRVGDLIYMEVVHVPGDVGKKIEARNEHRAYLTNRIDKVVSRPWPAKFRLSLQENNALKRANCGVDVQWDGSEAYVVLDDENGVVEVKGLARLWEWRDGQSSKVVEGLRGLVEKYAVKPEAKPELVSNPLGKDLTSKVKLG